MADPKVDAWMPLWIGAYLADTMTLTTQQHGAYLLLLFAYWRNRGPLADDDQDLASIVKASPDEWIPLRKKLERFFSVEAGVWRHKRADDELKNAQDGRAKASAKASKAAAAKWEKARRGAAADAPSIAQAVPKQCPTPPPSPDGGSSDEEPPPGGVSPYAAVCIALKAAGIPNVNPSHATLRALVEAGADVAEFVAHVKATEGKHDRFAYLLGIVEGQRKRAATTAGAIHHGPLRVVSKQVALEERNASVAASWARKGTVDAT